MMAKQWIGAALAVTFVIASVASMGLPGFSGFVAELQVLIGAWHAFPGFALLAGVGIVIGVAYTLRALRKSFFGDSNERGNLRLEHGEVLLPISLPERIGGLVLIGASLAIGLYPRLLLDLIGPSLDAPLFDGMRKAGML